MQPLKEPKDAIKRIVVAYSGGGPDTFSEALLVCVILVLKSDGPLNAFEVLFLNEFFGPALDVERLDVELKLDKGLGDRAIARLISVARSLTEHDVIAVIGRVFDLSLAADKLPSENEAWAAAKILSKIRGACITQIRANPVPAEVATPESLPSANDELVLQNRSSLPALETTVVSGETDQVNLLLAQLHRLVGLERVKIEVETLVNLAKVRAMRQRRGLPSPPMSFHLVFSGNPGTGKTTVARLIGGIYGALGLISRGTCIEIDRTNLVGQYLGETTKKTSDLLKRALGSVLFLDEAYSLTEGESNQYGAEALTVILKFMEDHRDDFVFIVAGYSEEMEGFLASNPGLRSRFSRTIEFPDYTVDELREILDRMCAANHYSIDSNAGEVIAASILQMVRTKGQDFANAREVRDLFEHALERQANRIAHQSCSDAELCTLTDGDFENYVRE